MNIERLNVTHRENKYPRHERIGIYLHFLFVQYSRCASTYIIKDWIHNENITKNLNLT